MTWLAADLSLATASALCLGSHEVIAHRPGSHGSSWGRIKSLYR